MEWTELSTFANYGGIILFSNLFSFQGTINLAEQSVVSVGNSSSSNLSANRISSEDFGDNLYLSNESGETEICNAQTEERSCVEQVRNVFKCPLLWSLSSLFIYCIVFKLI